MTFRSRGDKIYDAVSSIILGIIIIIMAYPIYFMVIASFSDPTFVNAGKVILLPKGIMLDGYKRIFGYSQIWNGYKNTILYTVLGTSINLCLTLTAGYCFSRGDFKGRKFFMLLFAFTMFFNGGMIPTYLLVFKLGIKDTIWAMVLPNAASVWNIIIARTFFQSNISKELENAAQIDGCGSIRFFFHIALPLSKALIAVLILFYAVGHWNAFFNALIYLESDELYPLQLILRNILLVNQAADPSMLGDVQDMIMFQKLADLIKYGIIVVAAVPVLILYAFMQKYFIKGVMVGSLKG